MAKYFVFVMQVADYAYTTPTNTEDFALQCSIGTNTYYNIMSVHCALIPSNLYNYNIQCRTLYYTALYIWNDNTSN